MMIFPAYRFRPLVGLLVFTLLIGSTAAAIQISPETRDRLENSGELDSYLSRLKTARSRGIDEPSAANKSSDLRLARVGTDIVDTVRALVLLVDFDDNPASSGYSFGQPDQFDSLLLSQGHFNPTGSLTEYYLENSYERMVVTGEVVGWLRMPNSYDYYVYDRYGMSGVFPRNSRGLVMDAVWAADQAGVDFSRFDSFGPDGVPDGFVDALIIIHAGVGAEESGRATDIHSHKWDMGLYKEYRDGVYIDDYTMQPEESYNLKGLSSIGVFCHEFGHILGLPDLYDVDGEPATSDGLGVWSLMAYGAYNGSCRLPAHLDAWSKVYLGFVEPVVVSRNLEGAQLPRVESAPVIYKLWKDGLPGAEYFLVENRQQVGFDQSLPGAGLLIYHVDDNSTFHNVDVDHYHVALEQADGLFHLEQTYHRRGDAGDPFPGVYDIREFTDLTTPSSRSHDGDITRVAVWNISDCDSLMTANFDINWSRPLIELDSAVFVEAQPDNIFAAGEKISVHLFIRNLWKEARDVAAELSSKSGRLVAGPVRFGTLAGDSAVGDNYGRLLEFEIPGNISARYDSLSIELVSDDGEYRTRFDFEIQLGRPDILLVDDDRGEMYDSILIDDLYSFGIPCDTWDKERDGHPSAETLKDYHLVIWSTGDFADNILQTDDIEVLESYLEGGGNLFLTGQGLAAELDREAPSFLENYLHARFDGPGYDARHVGYDGAPVGDGLKIAYSGGHNQDFLTAEKIVPASGGTAEFYYQDGGCSAVSFTGGFKTVFFCFGYEAIGSNSYRYDSRQVALERLLAFFGPSRQSPAAPVDNVSLPDGFDLEQNYPNPFNPVTGIGYSIAAGAGMSTTVLKVYNLLGREVKTLVDGYQGPGIYSVVWDGTDDSGRPVASGVYFCRLIRGDKTQSKKMLLLK